MALIAPFRALRYDPRRVSVARVVTQPYDKITPQMQEAYYAADPCNLVRIILGKREPEAPGDNVYTRAAAFFRDWRRQGIFLQDSQPSLYVYGQRFLLPGGSVEYERRGFIGLGRIEDYSAGVVFRHELTHSRPKADRLELLRSTRAHFGQLFMLYSDDGEIDSLLVPPASPEIEIKDEYGVLHRLWRVSDPGLIELVRGKMKDKKLIIADGHHRYETALNYRNQRRTSADQSSGMVPRERSGAQELLRNSEMSPYDLVMMTFVNMNGEGLAILPTHRIVHGLAGFSVEKFFSGARQYFNVEEVDSAIDAPRCAGLLRQAGRAGMALLALTRERDFLLHTPRATGALFEGLSVRQQSLDVVQLHKVLLENLLGMSEESIRNQENISYLRDMEEAIQRVRSGGANVAFLMNPVKMEQVRDIAFAGEVLPQKSTDFYPKLLSGLTIYALD
jgi:uncharacterized protein (DUF1015 family)